MLGFRLPHLNPGSETGIRIVRKPVPPANPDGSSDPHLCETRETRERDGRLKNGLSELQENGKLSESLSKPPQSITSQADRRHHQSRAVDLDLSDRMLLRRQLGREVAPSRRSGPESFPIACERRRCHLATRSATSAVIGERAGLPGARSRLPELA